MEGRSKPDVVQELVPDCWALVCKSTLASWLCDDKRDLKQTSVRGGVKLSGKNTNLENVGNVSKTGASDRRKTDGREFCSWFVDGLEASERHAEVGKHAPVLMIWRLPGLRCFGFFFPVSLEGTSGTQLEKSCSNQALTEQRNTRVLSWHQQRDSDGLTWVRNGLFWRLKCALWRWVLDQGLVR